VARRKAKEKAKEKEKKKKRRKEEKKDVIPKAVRSARFLQRASRPEGP
jgi:hypothetical protein